MYENLKRKYGQNFLIDNNILNKIKNLIPFDNLNILEIGPGDGKLTDKIILKKPSNLKIVEIDKDLINGLSQKYLFYNFIEVINDNVLNMKLEDKFDLVISNLPYNISSQILVKLSLLKTPPNRLILMFQKEFGKRLLDKKINSINSLIQCFYEIKLCFHISSNCFKPKPKVNSIVIHFKPKINKLFNLKNIKNLEKITNILFSNKRKMINKNLKKILNDEEISNIKDIRMNMRPSEIKPEIYYRITEIFEKR